MLLSSKRILTSTTVILPILKLLSPHSMTELPLPKLPRMIPIKELKTKPHKEMTAELNAIKLLMITNKEDSIEILIDKQFLTSLVSLTAR